MTLQEWMLASAQRVQESTILKHAVGIVAFLLIVLLLLFLIFLFTLTLRSFFKHHPFVNRAHRSVVYLLSMVGVCVLLTGALVGAMLPIVPGVLFLFFALLLLRKYHRNEWLDNRFKAIAHTLRIKIEERKRKREERKKMRENL
jgi:ABC-type phosphate transport system permease subunit